MSASVAAGDRGVADGSTSERIVAVVLLVIALLLGYLRFSLVRPARPDAMPFDLRNPMVDARVGECIEVEDSSQPGQISCEIVAEPGVVRRPALGPETLGRDWDGLRRMPPYLVCDLRFPEAGKGCSTSEGKHDLVLFDLNGFGVPSRIAVEVLQIQPVWRKWQGRVHYAYQVQMLRHGQLHGPWTLWISEEAPVTGVVYREFSSGARSPIRQAMYREVEGCTPPR